MINFEIHRHAPDDDDRITIGLMKGEAWAAIAAMKADLEPVSGRIALQADLHLAIGLAKLKGRYGYLTHCQAQLREILKHDRHSVEQAGYVRQALAELKRKP